MSSTEFREQVKQYFESIEDKSTGTIGITSDNIDAIVKLHEAEVERIIGEDVSHDEVAKRMEGIEDTASVHDAVYAVNDRLAMQRQRAAITPKEPSPEKVRSYYDAPKPVWPKEENNHA